MHVEEHEGFLQIDTVGLIWIVKPSQSPQNSKFTTSVLYLKQEVKDEVGYLHADKHEDGCSSLAINVSCKVIQSVLMGMIKHC